LGLQRYVKIRIRK